ncbi:unnamed protein product [Mytilus coruscus]|uniref:Uncharacterized protein n=1 Tax=Mytilus coruscus TaxID=42192 RepID=A0A6J8ET19_MYTCO|nr:unnamed protein product [Mytilus coruscus]
MDVLGITWDHAQDACKPNGLENREDYLRDSGMPDEHEFWIGKAIYRVPTQWIEIIGCSQIAEIPNHPFHSVASIGYCKRKCDYENMGRYFGYRQRVPNTQKQNCACLPNAINQTQQLDIQYCLNTTNFVLYREYNGTVTKSSDPGNCTTICCGNCNMKSGNDNRLEGRRCSSVNTKIVGRCGVIKETESKAQSPVHTSSVRKDEQVNTSTDPSFTQEKEKSNSQSTGAVIGGILGACSILVVSAVLIVCKLRSKGIFKESDTYENGETSQLHFSNTNNQDSTNTRNRKINDLFETSASRYSVVNNLTKPENMNETYTDAADGEYDVLHDKQNIRMCPTENVYHSHGAHRNEDCLTYDSADFGKGKCNDGNGLYDTSFSVVEGDYSYMSYKNRDHSMTTDIYDKST